MKLQDSYLLQLILLNNVFILLYQIQEVEMIQHSNYEVILMKFGWTQMKTFNYRQLTKNQKFYQSKHSNQKLYIQQDNYQTKQDIRSIIKNNHGVKFTVRGPSLYMVSIQISFENIGAFWIIYLSYVVVYAIGGILTITIIIRKENKTD
ncbi:hypothetical protein SS50377_25053 [Spironucleus salmonicida]|nr:hypothetical protein SS50377_25053 [Spironucleus salmonicida]